MLAILYLLPLILGNQFYPLTGNGNIPTIEPYVLGQEMFMDCISRNIDNGEHKFDAQDRIIHVPFPVCKETGKPLAFQYGISEDRNCTINFNDELYHLFQLYVHEDAPFSCRIPVSTESHYLEKGGAYIPLTFNFRGEIHDSHLDIDQSMNVIFTKPSANDPSQYSIISAIAYSSSTNVSRVVIGNDLTLNLAVRWLENSPVNSIGNKYEKLPFVDGFYSLPMNSIAISYSTMVLYFIIIGLASSAVTWAFSYNVISLKFSKRYQPLDQESTFSKRD